MTMHPIVSPNEPSHNGHPKTELENGSGDIIGILDTVDVPVIVVRRDCAIARFNRAATEVFGLALSDIGRLPANTMALGSMHDLPALCSRVFADGTPTRRDICHGNRWFIVRIAPYAGSNGYNEMAVLTFTNVTGFRASIGQAIYDREYTKAILNTMKEPVVVLDPALHVRTANQAFYKLFGVTREEVQNVSLADLGDHEWKRSALWNSLKERTNDDVEFKTFEIECDFSAGRKTVLLEASRFSQNGDTSLLLVFQDITERKSADEQLRRTQEELRDFVENATVGMHWVGPDGIILWTNHAELKLLGYSREEYVGHHIAKFHVNQLTIEDLLQRLSDGETLIEYPVQLRCKDGTTRDVLIDANAFREEGRFVHTRWFMRDITERKQAEKTLLEREHYFRQMIDALPAAIYTTDADGRLTHFNPAAVAFSGRTPALGTDQWCVTWKLFCPDGTPMPHDQCPMAIALKEGRTVRGTEAIAERPDGTRIWFAPYPTPLHDPEGNLIGGINMLVDITERKAAEAALHLAQAQLADRARLLEGLVLERTSHLQETTQQLEAFIYSVAHDLRAPLRGMNGFAEILKEGYASVLGEKGMSYVNNIAQSASHLDQLLRDLLEYSRISQNKLTLGPIGVESVVKSVVDQSRFEIAKSNAQIDIILPRPCFILGHPSMFATVLLNLIGNALKFVAPDVQPHVRIRAEEQQDQGMVRIWIEDNGIGIPPEQQERIFGIFERVHPGQYPGTGIGLAIVKKGVERMGGRIGVESVVGQGSRFWIQVPVTSLEEKQSREEGLHGS